MSDVYVGLMSGTSMDGIDAVLVRFGEASVEMLGTHSQAYPDELRNELLEAIREPLHVELDPTGDLDRRVGRCFRDAALAVIDKSGLCARSVAAIGSHGQTLRHQPNAATPFSLQIGNADIIVAGTGITTVSNFRAADIAVGGQGAPLVPPFHQWLFASPDSDRVIVNIGGIANITVLPGDGSPISGFDTGPGNGLMDAWIFEQHGKRFDRGGGLAAMGSVIQPLLAQFQADPYFALEPPKSTGFEYFNPQWMRTFNINDTDVADVQATLCELSAASIAAAIHTWASTVREVFVCGGGVHNDTLIHRLAAHLTPAHVSSTSSTGLDPDWIEAVALPGLPGKGCTTEQQMCPA